MLKKLTTIVGLTVLSIFLCVSVLFGADFSKTTVYGKAPAPIFEPGNVTTGYTGSPVGTRNAQGTAIKCAIMPNAYSPQSASTNLIYWDPWSGAMAIVHRDTSFATSGYITYTASFDDGATWTDGIGPFNFDGNELYRHHNLVISNPTKDTDPFNTVPMMSTNTLVPANWETIHFVSDISFLGATPTGTFASFLAGGHFVTQGCVREDDGTVFWPKTTQAAPFDLYLFYSSDQGASWDSVMAVPNTEIGAGFNYHIPEFTPDGQTGYLCLEGQTPTDDEYQFGYVMSTDGGVTWGSTPTWLPSSSIANLSPNISGLNYEYDMMVDGNGDAHFAGVYVDTVDGTNTGIYHVYNDGGTWTANLVTLVNGTNYPLPGGLQTLNEVELARNPDGTTLYMKWVDAPDPAANDTLLDVFAAAYVVSEGTWTTPENITQTPAIQEKYSNLAPRASANGDLYIYYTIFGDGDTNDLAPAELWFIDGVQILTSIDDNPSAQLINQYALKQNYPNPFNPTTTIGFDLKDAGNVSIEIFNTLGQKVATVLNQKMAAGTHEVQFDASDLTSGVYIYRLNANGTSLSRKMMLLK
jgi:hypothetical protein